MSLAKPVLFKAQQDEELPEERETKGSGVMGVPHLHTKDNYSSRGCYEDFMRYMRKALCIVPST